MLPRQGQPAERRAAHGQNHHGPRRRDAVHFPHPGGPGAARAAFRRHGPMAGGRPGGSGARRRAGQGTRSRRGGWPGRRGRERGHRQPVLLGLPDGRWRLPGGGSQTQDDLPDRSRLGPHAIVPGPGPLAQGTGAAQPRGGGWDLLPVLPGREEEVANGGSPGLGLPHRCRRALRPGPWRPRPRRKSRPLPGSGLRRPGPTRLCCACCARRRRRPRPGSARRPRNRRGERRDRPSRLSRSRRPAPGTPLRTSPFPARRRSSTTPRTPLLRIEFNDHQYQGTNQCQDRLQKLLDGRGITGPGDPRLVHLDGQFFVSTKTVRKLANWMLRNTHLANRSVDLDPGSLRPGRLVPDQVGQGGTGGGRRHHRTVLPARPGGRLRPRPAPDRDRGLGRLRHHPSSVGRRPAGSATTTAATST
jgi:hypothetical protein